MDWSGLDEVEAWERILREALACKCAEVLISADYRGGEVFFRAGETLRVFDHLPPEVHAPVCRYLKSVAGIDPYQSPPQEGLAALELDDEQYSLTVRTAKGSVAEDLCVACARL